MSAIPLPTPDRLEVRIHRGAHEIGGNCVELRHGQDTLILDIGKPLTAARDSVVPLPEAIGLDDLGTRPLGVIISHGHQDHWGLAPQLHTDIPVFIGEGAASILRAAQFWGSGVDLGEAGHLHDQVPFTLGPFTITPYLADHSAYDAFSLLIEAGGRSLFYTGDLRGHGRKASAFERLLADPPSPVHAILMEGTSFRTVGSHLAPAADPHGDTFPGVAPGPDPDSVADEVDPAAELLTLTESQVEIDLAETLRATKGLVLVLASAQNIDRLVTVYRAALRADRDLVVDLYTADIAAATSRSSIPAVSVEWPRIHVYAPLRQRVRVKESGQFERVARVKDKRLYAEQLRERAGRLVLFGAFQGEISAMIREGLLTGGAVVWSMWDGYLAQPSGQRLQTALQSADVPLISHHTSGHATPADLARLVQALRPDAVVPIHTEAPDAYAATVGDIVQPHPDGAWWTV
ncbi:MAG: ribonuclease [Actinomycetota bacterium]|nr:ribonuclease [Actinomycetota bacterium]